MEEVFRLPSARLRCARGETVREKGSVAAHGSFRSSLDGLPQHRNTGQVRRSRQTKDFFKHFSSPAPICLRHGASVRGPGKMECVASDPALLLGH